MSFIELKNIDQRELVPGCRARMVHSDNMTLIYWNFDNGAVIPGHKHPHEQIGSVITGSIEVTAAEETKVLGPGSVVIIPSNVEHSLVALKESYVIDAFYPVREDYR